MNKNSSSGISLLIPALNEAEAIKLTLDLCNDILGSEKYPYEIIVIDDGSTDNTTEIVKEIIFKNEKIKLIENKQNEGIWSSWQKGSQASKYDCVCVIDADLQYQPSDLKKLIKEHFNGNQFVQGVRASHGRKKDIRFIVSGFLNLLLKIFFFKYTKGLKDIKSGFFCTRKDLLINIFELIGKLKYGQTFVAIGAVFFRSNVKQIDVVFSDRIYGNSFIKSFPLKIILDVLIEILSLRLKMLRNNDNLFFLNKYVKERKYPENWSFFEKIKMEIYFKSSKLHKWVIGKNLKEHLILSLNFAYLSEDDILKYQNEKLRNLVWYFYENSTYFREKMKNQNTFPYEINSIKDIKNLPVLTKKDIREANFKDLLSKNIKKSELWLISTSGSSGEPLNIYVNRSQLEVRWANTIRAWTWTGWTPRKKQARLWHQTIGMNILQIIREYLDSLFFKRIFIPAYEINEENIDFVFKKLIRHKPFLIDGYAESFNFLSEYLEKNSVDNLNIDSVISSAQELPKKSKKLIEKNLGTIVYDKYGSREFSGIAYESKGHDGHLIMDDSYLVEILNNNKEVAENEIGEVHITDLNNYAMPMVRYKIGDIAERIKKDNNNKIKFNVLGEIEGRVQAIIRCNDKWIPGTFFAHFFKEYTKTIKFYRVEQHIINEIKLLIVLRGNKEDVDPIISELRKTVGDIKIDIQYVESIPMIRTGKRMGAVSYLDNNEILNNN